MPKAHSSKTFALKANCKILVQFWQFLCLWFCLFPQRSLKLPAVICKANKLKEGQKHNRRQREARQHPKMVNFCQEASWDGLECVLTKAQMVAQPCDLHVPKSRSSEIFYLKTGSEIMVQIWPFICFWFCTHVTWRFPTHQVSPVQGGGSYKPMDSDWHQIVSKTDFVTTTPPPALSSFPGHTGRQKYQHQRSRLIISVSVQLFVGCLQLDPSQLPWTHEMKPRSFQTAALLFDFRTWQALLWGNKR